MVRFNHKTPKESLMTENRGAKELNLILYHEFNHFHATNGLIFHLNYCFLFMKVTKQLTSKYVVSSSWLIIDHLLSPIVEFILQTRHCVTLCLKTCNVCMILPQPFCRRNQFPFSWQMCGLIFMSAWH